MELKLQDNHEIVGFFKNQWEKVERSELTMEEATEAFLKEQTLWGMDLSAIPNLVRIVTDHLLTIHQRGVKGALKQLFNTTIL